MKLKFKAINQAPHYTINNETINGIDLSVFPENGKFVGDETTTEAGIHSVERTEGILYVTLAQSCTAYQTPVPSHDWRGSGDYIDSADFSNDICYLKPIAAPEGFSFINTPEGWSVRMPQEVINELV